MILEEGSATAMPSRWDVVIIGSGFAGSLLAWILANRGRSVVVVDRARHPRFAIGESSTPLADFLLAKIADDFDLPELKSLSRWGSWQADRPELRAGKKRGFSYFRHYPDTEFSESQRHESSLLVAASATDDLSDTHWMRSDVDAWFARQATSAGVSLIENFRIESIQSYREGWKVAGEYEGDPLSIAAGQIVDATGGQSVLARALNLRPLDDELRVRTGALFGHFRDVGSMTDTVRESGICVMDDPFDADDAAQHHLLESGWLWMLRFIDGTTSVGLVQNFHLQDLATDSLQRDHWQRTIATYPTLANLLQSARLVEPCSLGKTQLGFIPRISRLWERAAGQNWALLPSTAGVVDPLHSTGIAHSLYGVLRVAKLLAADRLDAADRKVQRQQYSDDLVAEVQWIDRIVHCCNVSAKHSFELFVAACSLYFVAAIHSERQLATRGSLPDGFLLHQHELMRRTVTWFENALAHRSLHVDFLIQELRDRLSPLNDVGLMDPSLNHRLARSVAPK